MNSTNTLPPGYYKHSTLDLSHNYRAILLLNLAAIPVAILSVIGLLGYVSLFRNDTSLSLSTGGLSGILGAIALYVVMILLHEALHGLFFWRYTGARPSFGLGFSYAYAAAPGWYIPRGPYFVVALSPFVGITLLGLLLLPFVPGTWVLPIGFIVIANAAGCVGDFAVFGWLLRHPVTLLVEDTGNAMTVYFPSDTPESN